LFAIILQTNINFTSVEISEVVVSGRSVENPQEKRADLFAIDPWSSGCIRGRHPV
jgi:hypothetical protein